MNEIHRHNSDIVSYSSSLRAKECNLNDVCLESSKLAVVNHGQSSQDSNNQTGSVTYQSVPKDCVVKVVSESGKRELFARKLTPRERPKVTLRPSWVHTRSNAASMPRETKTNLQAWNSDPHASGSRTWPKEETNSLLISESAASPTTRLARTNSSCKESQNKSKTCDYKKNKRRLTQGQHSQ